MSFSVKIPKQFFVFGEIREVSTDFLKSQTEKNIHNSSENTTGPTNCTKQSKKKYKNFFYNLLRFDEFN